MKAFLLSSEYFWKFDVLLEHGGDADCGSLVLSHFSRSIMEDAGATRDEIVPQHWDFSQNNSENSRKQNSQKSKFDLELNSTMSIETLYEWAILYAKSLKPVFTWY